MKGRFQLATYAKFNRPDPMRDWDWLRPHTLNLYEYVGNDPINAWDPTGLIGEGSERQLLANDLFNQGLSEEEIQAGLDTFDSTLNVDGVVEGVTKAITFSLSTVSTVGSNTLAFGTVRGDVSSLPENLQFSAAAGQVLGDAISIGIGITETNLGLGGTVGGFVLAGPSGGTTLVASAGGAALTGIGLTTTTVSTRNLAFSLQNMFSFSEGTGSSEHTKGARPSTKGKHEKGQATKKKSRGGEKGDKNRRVPRKRPDNHKGPWPPT